jgi:uncharacterized protein (DUF1501 family)
MSPSSPRIIQARGALGAGRDAFFVKLGGFDTHLDVAAGLARGLRDVDAALASFAAEMRLQGVWGNVTVVSASEFGRTLTSNGLGTDHGWGGNHFVCGGAVRGGQVREPSLACAR